VAVPPFARQPAHHGASGSALAGKVGRLDWALTGGLAVASLGLYLFRLGTTSLWGDELFSVLMTNAPWPTFWNYFWEREGNMLLYYLVLRGWLTLTAQLGLVPRELVVRAPSVFFAVLAVIVVYWLGRRFWGRTVGVIGSVLYVVNHVQLTQAREARSYSLQMLMVCLGWYALLAALGGGRHRRWWWAGYAVAMILALYAHLFSGLVLAAQLVAFLALLVVPNDWRDRARHSVVAMVVSVTAIGVALGPVAGYFGRHGSNNTWVAPANAVALARLLWNISGHQLPAGAVLGVAATLGIVLTAAAGRRVRGRPGWQLDGATLALGCWLIVPIVLSYALTQPRLNLHLFVWGYLVVVIPPLSLLAGIGVTLLPWRQVRPALALGLVATALLALPSHYAQPPQDFRGAMQWIEARYRSGDGLVCTSWSCPLAVSYYGRIDGAPPPLTTDVLGQWSWADHGSAPLDPDAVAAFAAAHGRIFYVDSLTRDEPADLHLRARTAQAWLDQHHDQLAGTILAGPILVRLYGPR
jgi:4-amino-4-deoxy-L-arabinose transferase-like glycosyltransferase